jgi:nucleotide-binding universal stress UspA family protein
MIALSRILVDVDTTLESHPALEQAAGLASRCGASLKIVDVLPDVPSNARTFVNEAIERDLVAYRQQRLTEIATTVSTLPVTTALLRGRPAIALVQEVLRSRHDLLMRSHGAGAAPERPFGAVDMHLLRQCPCPVWLVGASAGKLQRIAAAVNTSAAETVERGLNTTILEFAVLLRELEGATLTVLQAWTAYGESLLSRRVSAKEMAEYVEAARRAAVDGVSALIEPFGQRLQDVDMQILKGDPEKVIPHFVQSHGIDLVVMGTVARTGVPGFIIGNTAERVLQRLRGSVLAVKPPGFQSQIRLPAET